MIATPLTGIFIDKFGYRGIIITISQLLFIIASFLMITYPSHISNYFFLLKFY